MDSQDSCRVATAAAARPVGRRSAGGARRVMLLGIVAAMIAALLVGLGTGPAAAGPAETTSSTLPTAPTETTATDPTEPTETTAPTEPAETTAPTEPAEPAASGCHPYPDVTKANQHCQNIDWLKDQQITKPADGLYHPESSVTRGSMAAFLFRLTHRGEAAPVCTDRPFPDVPTSHLFCGYIQWAGSHGIAFGYDNGDYGPARPVTRGAMAAFLYRIANTGIAAPACTESPFSDVAIDDTFCGVITWMRTAHITYGVDEGVRYDVTGDVTRQAMASFLRRIDDYLQYGPGIVCPAPPRQTPTEPRRASAARLASSRYSLGPVTEKAALIADTIGPRFGITTIYGWRAPASEQYDPNGHPAGLALDFMIDNVPNGTDVGYQLAEYLQRNQTWIGVKYVIYRQHIWMGGSPFDRWRLMEDRGSPTQNHMDHVHLSLIAQADGAPSCRA